MTTEMDEDDFLPETNCDTHFAQEDGIRVDSITGCAFS